MTYYKSYDFLNNNKRYKLRQYFNPYEYNIESTYKDNINYDINKRYSVNHNEENRKR
jgi:hypothetical protein